MRRSHQRVDPATTRSILELLKDINRRLGLTILLITHEMDVVKRICDQVAVISQGQLIEKDSVSEVFSHPKTPLAQQFIQSTLHLDIPDDYAARLSPERQGDRQPLLRLNSPASRSMRRCCLKPLAAST